MTLILKSPAILILAVCLAFPPPGASALEEWFAKGLASLKNGQYAEALSAFNKALEDNPDHANAYNGRGAVWHRLGAYDRAIADYTHAININPRYANAFNNRAVAWYQKGDYDRAIVDCDRALAIRPDYVNARINRGAAQKKLGKFEQALDDFERAIAIRPAYEAYNLLAWTLATCPDAKFRDGPRAVEMAEKAVAMKTENRSMGTLAAAYAADGRFERAADIQKQVIQRLQADGPAEELAEHEARLKAYRAKRPAWQIPEAKRRIVEKDLTGLAAAAPMTAARPSAQPEQKPVPPQPEQKPAPPQPEQKPAPPQPVQKPAAMAPAVAETPAPPMVSETPFTVQISSFRNRQTAFREALKLSKKGDPAFNAHAYVPSKGGDWFRLFIGVFKTAEQAHERARTLKQRGFRYARVVKMPWAVALECSETYPSVEKLEQGLMRKAYLPYRVSAGKSGGDARLLIGAFESEAAAVRQRDMLRADGFSPRMTKR